MAEPVLIETRIRAGIWEGVLKSDIGGAAPEIEVVHLDKRLAGATVASLPDRAGHWLLRLPIAAEHLSDGVQTFVVRNTATGSTLGHFTIHTGTDDRGDLRAEVDLLRAELDLLKRAFRRHCAETA